MFTSTFHSKHFIQLIFSISIILFSAFSIASQPFHQTLGNLKGYEDEDIIVNSVNRWQDLPSYLIENGGTARINSYASRKIRLNQGDLDGDKILWRFYNPVGVMTRESNATWTGNCWYVIFLDCFGDGGWIEHVEFLGNELGTWRIDTVDVSQGTEVVVSSESFELKGRKMEIMNGAALTVYEEDNSGEPLSIKLIDYDNVSGTPSHEVTFEVISKPKGKANGGINRVFYRDNEGHASDLINTYTNSEGIARVYMKSGSKAGTYTIRATSYWAPESPQDFQVTVVAGKDPTNEDDIIDELVDKDRNNGSPLQCEAEVGNPINVINGNKFQREVDYKGKGFMPLEFVRYYNSNSNVASTLGPRWSHTYSRFIETATEDVNGNSETVAKLHRDDGKILRFYKIRKNWLPVNTDIRTRLTLSSKKWQYVTEQGTVELYNQRGVLQSITHEDGNAYTLSYLETGELDRVTRPSGSSISFFYNGANALRGMYVNNDRIYYYIDEANGMLSGKSQGGESRYYHYEHEKDSALLTGITDENDVRFATWEYDNRGRATASYHAGGIDAVYIDYRDDGTRSITHANGSITEAVATGQNGLGLITDSKGPTCASGESSDKSSSFDPATNNLISKTVDGVTTNYGNYDLNGNVGFVIEAVGTPQEKRTNYTYDSRFFSKISEIQEPSVSGGVKTTSFFYDDLGHLLQQSVQGFTSSGSPIQRSTKFEYNGVLGQLSLIDGARTDVNDVYVYNYYPLDYAIYNDRGMNKEIIGPDGVVLKGNITYEKNKNITSETRTNGVSIDNTYSRYTLNLESKTVTSGTISRTTFWTYTPYNLVSSVTTGNGTSDAMTLSFSYDNAHRLTHITNGLGDYLEYVLDAKGNVIEEKINDAQNILNQHITNVYDAYDHLVSKSSGGQVVNSTFTAKGQLLQQTDGNDVESNYSYDALKRLTKTVNDAGGLDSSTANATVIINYDIHDKPISVTDSNGNTTSYQYDDLGNLLEVQSPDSGIIKYTYDSKGNISSKLDAKSQLFSYQYNTYNQILSVDTEGTIDDVNYVYGSCTKGNQLLCSVTRDNVVVSYTYNGFGEVANLSQQIGNNVTSTSYVYDFSGRLKELSYPSGAKVNYFYDSAGNIISSTLNQGGNTQSIFSNAKYTFNGLLTNLSYGNGLNYSKSINLAGRIINLNNGLEIKSYIYDAAGNILTETANQYSYDALNRLTDATDSLFVQTFEYDLNGNRIKKTTNGLPTNYGIDVSSNKLNFINGQTIPRDLNGNQLLANGIGLTYTPDNKLSSAIGVSSYSYNGLGQRVTKSIIATNETTHYFYDYNGNLIAEIDANGSILFEHVYLGSMPIAAIEYTNEVGELFYVHTDNLTTPRSISNSATDTVWHWKSDSFGSGSANEDVDVDGVFFKYNKRFPGQYWDEEKGSYYNMFRDYDPEAGRYLQSDPIGLAGGMNTYAYVGGNPVTKVDPLGLSSKVIGGTCLVGLAGSQILSAKTIGGWQQSNDFLSDSIDRLETKFSEHMADGAKQCDGGKDHADVQSNLIKAKAQLNKNNQVLVDPVGYATGVGLGLMCTGLMLIPMI